MPTEPGFSGEILIDADGRVLFSGASVTLGKSIRSRGYVSLLTVARAEITLTAGKTVGRMRCFIESRDVLNCDDVESTGRIADPYSLRRIGPGPVNLLK